MTLISPRATTLVSACVASLSAGTNYLFSAYAPQLASRLSLTSTTTNLIGASGNLGVYLSGPFVGISVDKRGPRYTLAYAALALGIGYAMIRAFYDGGETGLYAQFGLGGLALAEILTGTGSSAALSSASNGVAKSFGTSHRASAMSLVMSGFGLSAFFYSTLSHFDVGSDPTSSFLLLLAVGTFLSMVVGAVFVRPIPYSNRTDIAYAPLSDDESERRSGSSAPVVATGPRMSPGLEVDDEESIQWATRKDDAEANLDITGWAMLRESEFYNLFLVSGLCAGIGLMFINNVGTVALTLASPDKDPRQVTKLQANLVSLLSVFNCLGRLVAGFTSDYFAHHAPIRFARVWFLVPMSSLFVISQLLAARTTVAEGFFGLALPTMTTGLAYGMLFGLMPVLVLESFGIKNFSSNNGIVSLAPAIFGNLANIIFGTIYDSHVKTMLPVSLPTLLSIRADGMLLAPRAANAVDRVCLLGPECFVAAFHLTTAMAFLAVALSVLAALRKTRKMACLE